MSRVGNCYDNAVIESFFGILKTECVTAQSATQALARTTIFEYIEVWYNRKRLHSTLGYLSSIEFERLHGHFSCPLNRDKVTKIHIRCEGSGRLITLLLTAGQESNINLAEDLMKAGPIRRRTGQVRLHPKRLVADKGYPSQAFRNYLHRKHTCCTITHRKNEHHKGQFNKSHYRKRNMVERLVNRLKQFRRIATRYEKRAATFSAMITIAPIFLFSDFAYRL